MNDSMRRLTYAIAIVAAALSISPARAQTTTTPIGGTLVQPAVDGIFEAFKTHPLVGLGDDHGLAQEMDFYAALVRDPRFAREVGNLVVEAGAGGRQGVIDRYVAGETVPYTELRTVWSDTVGWIPPAGYLGFAKLFAAVRAVNKALPPDERIRIWLGEPPIDWSAASLDQVQAAMSARDSYPASVIDQNILAKGRKALVIYGLAHFADSGMLRGRVEAEHPGAFFTVLPYSAVHHPPACDPLLDQAAKVWPTPALAAPARGSVPDAAMRACATWVPSANGAVSFSIVAPPSAGAARPTVVSTFTLSRQLPAEAVAPQSPGPVAPTAQHLNVNGDAVLFLGPLGTLAKGPALPDYFLDTDYRIEMSRRRQVGGPPLVRFPTGADFSFRKADYSVDLDAPGYAERLDAMFAVYDRNGDGVVSADEYADPISP
jgi:hypothetical protein